MITSKLQLFTLHIQCTTILELDFCFLEYSLLIVTDYEEFLVAQWSEKFSAFAEHALWKQVQFYELFTAMLHNKHDKKIRRSFRESVSGDSKVHIVCGIDLPGSHMELDSDVFTPEVMPSLGFAIRKVNLFWSEIVHQGDFLTILFFRFVKNPMPGSIGVRC